MRLLCGIVLMAACSVPQPELPAAEPVVEVRPHRSIDELPGPHPMPVPTRAVEPDPDDWSLVDAGTIEPLAQAPCNPGLAPLYAALESRDATMAAQVRRATLGCLAGDRLADARVLVDSLAKNEMEPIDHYVIAKVLLKQRAVSDNAACAENAFLFDVFQHVTDAKDPVVSARMLNDADFQPIHGAFPYRRVTMPGVDNDVDRLEGTTWYGPGMGVFGTLKRLELAPGGIATLHSAEVSPSGEPVWSEHAAVWSMQDEQLSVTVGEAVPVLFYMTPAEGTLTQDPTRNLSEYYPYPSECEA